MKTIAKSSTLRVGLVIINLIILTVIFFASCNQNSKSPQLTRQQLVSQTTLGGVRLADGMPLEITLSTRWEVHDREMFEEKFGTAGRYETLVLYPMQKELASQVAINFAHIDSVFTSQRHLFTKELKKHLLRHLGESDVEMKEVIISSVQFPESYTSMKEKLALQEQELKSIQKQSVIDLEQAEARKKQAIAQGAVNVEQAQLDAKLEQIQASMEESRRASRLARAETEKQVAAKRAESDARRQVLMAQADAEQRTLYADVEVEKTRKLKDLEVERQEELAEVELNKKRLNGEIAYQADLKMSGLCEQSPAYASYLINKEMAEKVQIAVLPSGKHAQVFDGLLSQTMEFEK
ncbi:MAG: SPFH domain-containing protein [Owenweeksia sp.]|nr:SPFH domain-containing protein [Owenweeksia sp.]